MKKLAYNILAVLLMAVFVAFLVAGNVFKTSVSVVTPAGSYAEEYARKHHLLQVNSPDSLIYGTELRYETFSYNLSAGVLTLEKYNGVGKELVIPVSINGYSVVKLGENFFKDSPTVSDVYLAPLAPSLNGDPADGVTIHVNSGTSAESELTEAGWTVKTYNDSDMPIFSLGDLPFEYNVISGGMELVLYTGNDSTLLIPAYIDGRPVTTISFDLFPFDLVSFPATVTNITGKTNITLYTKAFVIELVFTIGMFLMVLLILNFKFPMLRNKNEFLLTGPQIVLSYVFFIIQIAFALLVIYRSIVEWPLAFLISAIIVVGYLSLVLMAGQGRKHAISVTEKNKIRTEFMDELKLSVANLADGIEDQEAKKKVTRLVEEIRYSDATDNEALAEIQAKLKMSVDSLKEVIQVGEKGAILRECESTMRLIQERNAMCKANK